MPTFTTIAFERMLETQASQSLDVKVHNSHSKPPLPKPASNSKLERRHSTSSAERRSVRRPQMTPSLYATPEATPLPDSHSSFSPSPYVIDHKRRGPRLVKSLSEVGMSSSLDKPREEEKANGSSMDPVVTNTDSGMVKDNNMNGVNDVEVGKRSMESENSVLEVGGFSSSDDFMEIMDSPTKPETLVSEKMVGNKEIYESQESPSHKSNTEEAEDNSGRDHGQNIPSAGEFFDAWEELSSESGQQQLQLHYGDLEKELREMRLSLLMEIEKRKQAEEGLSNLLGQWKRLREELCGVGLALPKLESEQELGGEVVELSQQVVVARFVAEAMGRGTATAVMEQVMEDEMESKNFEIARLIDRLHYYEAVNREMSQRNQEALERTRRQRQLSKRRQKWVWGSVAAAVSVGAIALLCSYYPLGKGSSTSAVFTKEIDHPVND